MLLSVYFLTSVDSKNPCLGPSGIGHTLFSTALGTIFSCLFTDLAFVAWNFIYDDFNSCLVQNICCFGLMDLKVSSFILSPFSLWTSVALSTLLEFFTAPCDLLIHLAPGEMFSMLANALAECKHCSTNNNITTNFSNIFKLQITQCRNNEPW